MGLKHGHQDYTNSDLSFYFGTAPRFGTQSLTPDRDGQAWSLMTYTPAPFTNSNFAGEKMNQPQTYMQYDLAALQYLYGANYNTHAEDSVYTFSQTTGEGGAESKTVPGKTPEKKPAETPEKKPAATPEKKTVPATSHASPRQIASTPELMNMYVKPTNAIIDGSG